VVVRARCDLENLIKRAETSRTTLRVREHLRPERADGSPTPDVPAETERTGDGVTGSKCLHASKAIHDNWPRAVLQRAVAELATRVLAPAAHCRVREQHSVVAVANS
jgi:hypothetical protein